MKTKVSVVKCKDYDPDMVYSSVSKAVELIGGISDFVKPGSRVLVKPNLLTATFPESGIDTHPEVVRSVIKLLKGINCKIFLGDGPSVWGGQADNPDRVYEMSGMKKVCLEEGVEIVKFDKRRWRGKFPLTTWLDECDFFVSVPKFKTHELTVLTAGVKNLFGLVSGTYKTELHKRYFQPREFVKILVDIYQEAKPHLTVIDGILAMEGDGPASAGKLRKLGLVFAGGDAVAVDSVLSRVMGLKPFDILTTKEAVERGLGVGDIAEIEVCGERLEEVCQKPFILPVSSKRRMLPESMLNFMRRFIHYYPVVRQDVCVRCGACIEVCPQKIISKQGGKIVIDYSKCISCFCCQEACPNAAIKVRKSLFAKIIGL